MNMIEAFEAERDEAIKQMTKDTNVKEKSIEWLNLTGNYKYSYNFKWLGRPIIQMPTDIVALQEIIWEIKPDLIIETGVAHGGSIIFYASMLELIGEDGKVLGIDIDIRSHNRVEIENHKMIKRIEMIEGSSIDKKTLEKVEDIAKNRKCIMVILDSCHTHEHVFEELKAYSKFVTEGSYLVVLDTAVEFISGELSEDRPWGKGDNPWTATQAFLETTQDFEIDQRIPDKLLLTAAYDGYLRRVKCSD